MKNKIITIQVCLVLLCSAQFLFGQTLFTTATNYDNHFTPGNCSNTIDWAACTCNAVINTPSNTWPYNSNAHYEWQRIGAGDKIFGLSGSVLKASEAGSDFPFSHVFGFNPADPDNDLFNDWESYIILDAPYLNLLSKGNNPHFGDFEGIITTDQHLFNYENSTLGSGIMGLEMESAFIPEAYRSKFGDRTVVFGDLIADCGHDDGGFHTEIHPPLMLVNARAFNGTNLLNKQQRFTNDTSSVTFGSVISSPYQITQLYNDNQNFLNAASLEMFKAISAAQGWGWLTLYIAPTYQLKMNANLADKPFKGNQVMTFDIYPQHPRQSPDDILWHQFHYTVRSGVNVSVTRADDHFTVTVTMNEAAYISANNLLKPHTRNIGYNDFAKENYVGVYTGAFVGTNAIIPGIGPILGQGIESIAYETPKPEAGLADLNIFPSPLQPNLTADISDDQPFPIYGWMVVGWKKAAKVRDICAIRPSPLASSVGEVNFFPNNLTKSQLVTITNPTDAPIQLGKLFLDGANPNGFELQYHDILLLRRGGSQPPEDCSNTILQPHSSCSFRVAMLPNTSGNNVNAIINIPGGGPCPLKLAVHQLNGVN